MIVAVLARIRRGRRLDWLRLELEAQVVPPEHVLEIVVKQEVERCNPGRRIDEVHIERTYGPEARPLLWLGGDVISEQWAASSRLPRAMWHPSTEPSYIG